MGKKQSKVFGTTGTLRVYYVEQAPLAFADGTGKIYTADPNQPVWVLTPAGEKIRHGIPEAILSPYGTAPGGSPSWTSNPTRSWSGTPSLTSIPN